MSGNDAAPPIDAPVTEIDVRPLLAGDHEPMTVIMQAVSELSPGAVLVVRAPFNPRPLHAVLRGRGFQHAVRKLARRDFEVRYWREAGAPQAASTVPDPEAPPPVAYTLDVRGLTPPEPLERTLAALGELADGTSLAQVNDRAPAFLVPILEERGYRYVLGEDARGVIVTIWRSAGTRA